MNGKEIVLTSVNELKKFLNEKGNGSIASIIVESGDVSENDTIKTDGEDRGHDRKL